MKPTSIIMDADFWIDQWNASNASAATFQGYRFKSTWNAMAGDYGKHHDPAKTNTQIQQTCSFLEERGFCFSNARILDVGCGPGMYARAFAERGGQVVCLDISENMIHRLESEQTPEAKEKISARAADWRSLDLTANTYNAAFDLVFANMTPAIAGPADVLRMIQASRGLCWFRGWMGKRDDSLCDFLHHAITGKKSPEFNGNFLYAFNLVCALSFFPECRFSPVQWVHKKTIPGLVEFYSHFFSNIIDRQPNDLKTKIEDCLRSRAVDGMVETSMRGHTGSMLWSVNTTTGDVS